MRHRPTETPTGGARAAPASAAAQLRQAAPNGDHPVPGPDGEPAQRRHAPRSARAALAAVALAACGGGGTEGGGGGAGGGAGGVGGAPAAPGGAAGTPAANGVGDGTLVPTGSGAAPVEITDVQAARFLQQAQFSSSEAEIAQVRTKGYAGWLTEQMARPMTESGWDWLIGRGYNRDADGFIFNRNFADHMVWRQLMAADDPVRKRMALALSEILVVSTDSIDAQSASFTMAAYWDLLNRNAFGNFRQLLGEVTLNPAMGMYLNTRGNEKEAPATGRQPDENYAREVMQLFTIGLYQIDPDGTPKIGAGGKPIETYGPSDVSNLARVFTGYVLNESGHVRGTSPERYRNPMVVNPARHSTLDVNFLGTRIAGDAQPDQKLNHALDTLFNHANTGPFIARQLIQRLVTSAPGAAYVGRVAAVFGDNGAGVRGDLAAVLEAILTDPEARQAPAQASPTWGKLREPMIRCVQWARTFGASSNDGAWLVGDKSDPSTGLGQSPLRSPSVFNFFRPGYVPPGTALAASGQTAPEFQIANESSVAGYVNFMETAIAVGIAGSKTSRVLVENYAAEMALVNDPTALVNRLNLLLAAGQLSSATTVTIRDAIASIDPRSDYGQKSRVWAAILLVMSCPEYLVQK